MPLFLCLNGPKQCYIGMYSNGAQVDLFKIKEMKENGFANKRIALNLKLDISEVNNIIKYNNWQTTKEIFTEQQIERIISLYKDGVSAKQLGIKFSMSKGKIQQWAEAKGILRDKNQSHRFTNFNQHIFDIIDTEEKAYWLGFFYADAYNCDLTNTVNLALQSRDIGHLQKLAIYLNLPTEKITTSKGGDNEQYEHCSLKMYSKHLSETLTLLGCPRAKSFIIKYPLWLNSELNRHFIRGMFDGDRCITLRKKQKEWKWSLVSTMECCQSIQNIIKDTINVNINFESISNTNNNTFCMETSGNEKILKIMDWLYKDSNVYLDRKHSKYLELIDQQNNRKFLKTSNRTSYFKQID